MKDLDVEIEESLLKITVNAHQDKEVFENDYIIFELILGLSPSEVNSVPISLHRI